MSYFLKLFFPKIFNLIKFDISIIENKSLINETFEKFTFKYLIFFNKCFGFLGKEKGNSSKYIHKF